MAYVAVSCVEIRAPVYNPFAQIAVRLLAPQSVPGPLRQGLQKLAGGRDTVAHRLKAVVKAGRARLVWLGALFLLLAPGASAANLVVNGSFEANPCDSIAFPGATLGLVGSDLIGWFIPSSDGIYPWCLQNDNIVAAGPTPFGNRWLVLGEARAGVNRTIQQTITGLTSGNTYRLSFAIASEVGCCSIAEESFLSGSSTPPQDFTAPASGSFWTSWATETMNFVATSSSVTLQFKNLVTAQTGGLDLGLDNVDVEAAPAQQKVSLTLDESTIEPSPSHLEQNLVRVSVAVTDGTGQSIPNVDVTLKAQPVDLVVAGHDHAGPGPGLLNNLASAPTGTFEDIATRQAIQGCTTGADATCQAFYAANAVSGVYKISAALSDNGTISESKGLTVRVGGVIGLVSLKEDPRYELVGQFGTDAVTSQHTINHFGTLPMTIRVSIVGALYFAFSRMHGVLGINDLSLPWGGLFDIGNRWSPPHNLHRTGGSVDINTVHVNAGGAVNTRLLKELAEPGLTRIPEPGKIHYELSK